MTGAGPWGELAAGWEAIPGVRVDVTVRVARRSAAPQDVVRAFDIAAREATRNAVRHGGARVVEMDLVVDRSRAELYIRDRGRGFDMDACPPGHGIEHSILGLLARVGGHADVSSLPGEGVDVRLSWHAERGSAAGLRRNHAEAAVLGWRVLAGVVGAMVVGNVLLALGQLVVHSGPSGLWLILAAALALVGWSALVYRRGPRVADVLSMGAAAAGLTGCAVLVSGAEALTTLESWYVGFLAFPLALIAFITPGRLLLLLLGPDVAVLLSVVLVSPAVGPAGFGAVNAVLLPALGSWAVGTFLRRSARRLQARRRELAVLTAHHAAEDAVDRLRRRYFQHATDDIGPFLASIGDGRVDPVDPRVRAEARQLVLLARDDLYLPGYFDADLRREVQHFRGRGGTVTVEEGLPAGARRRPDGEVLHLLLSRLGQGSHVSMRTTDHGVLSGRVVVTPPVPAELRGELETLCVGLGCGCRTTEHETVVEVPLPLDQGMPAAVATGVD